MAFEVTGAIGDHYNEAGGASSPLGEPTSAEQDAPNGGKFQEFTGGVIYFKLPTGAKTVYGAIRQAWEAEGGAGGRFGYPTSDEQDIEGGKISHFENGSISYSIADDAVTVNA
ncbi:LGFP repeat-containing protein [Nocardia fluminea]|uniref:LGFP repeat-containing protein n=1 Tax=Nocardia fluminea TaxID=134984 RepID=A0A2N3WZ33_9NOCA|nr:esterase [Nocardia fluminea]PKV99125.1 LGFP repeat-containing protein [Nocardia fluminea]